MNDEILPEENSVAANENKEAASKPAGFDGLSRPLPEHVNAAVYANGNTYLHELCARNAPLELIDDAVRVLGADVNICNLDHQPPLGLAIEGDKLALVTRLCQLGAAFLLPPYNAALQAVNKNQLETLRVVLEAGGGECLGYGGLRGGAREMKDPVLYLAVEQGRAEMLPLLVAHGSLVNGAPSEEGDTPLHLAIRHANPEMTLLLIGLGADVNAKDAQGRTPLHLAATNSRQDAASALLNAGAAVNTQDKQGETPLMGAARLNNAVILKMLLDAGADPDAQNPGNQNRTALMAAAAAGHTQICEVLLAAGANLLLMDDEGKTASDCVARESEAALYSSLQSHEAEQLRDHFERAHRRLVTAPRKPPAFGV